MRREVGLGLIYSIYLALLFLGKGVIALVTAHWRYEIA